MKSLTMTCRELLETEWVRPEQPILSTFIEGKRWASVSLYNPTVCHHDGRFRMWFLGGGERSRSDKHSVGYAESVDGIHWTRPEKNPILKNSSLPWKGTWQTPCVRFDSGKYRMWFTTSRFKRDSANRVLSFSQRLAHAESADGITWSIHPETLFPSLRAPWVLKTDEYHMWANSAPGIDEPFQSLVENIYHFQSSDGMRWTRDATPCVTAGGGLKSVVYPCVMRCADGYVMYYGAHVEGGYFELYASSSKDGRSWTHHRTTPVFPASRRRDRFDGRYTSTPCLVSAQNRLWLFYSARDLDCLYSEGGRRIGYEGAGIYRHIGLAFQDLFPSAKREGN